VVSGIGTVFFFCCVFWGLFRRSLEGTAGQVEVEEVGGVVGVWWSTRWLGSWLKRQDELKKRHSLSVLMSLC